MKFNRHTLKNGLRVITIPMPSFESATVLVMVGAGSRYEERRINGISHFLEHMAFKGTEKRPTSRDISGLIDGIGGEFNAYTGKETTGYYIKAAKSNVKTCLDVLSDMLKASKLDEKEIEKEKGVIMEEINLYEDMPSRKIGDIYEELLYGDTPMGWDIAGEKQYIMGLNRQDFVDYMSTFYSPQNMTVIVAGGIEEKETLAMIEDYFGDMKQFTTRPYLSVKEEQSKPATLIKHKVTEQVHLALGVRTIPIDHPDKEALDVLSAVLGGGMSSRLFHEVREERGLAYYVRSSSDHYMDCGSLVSAAGIDPKKVTEALEVMLVEYRKAKDGVMNITKQEIKKAKEYIKGHLVLELEDSRSVANYYAHQELTEKSILNPDEVLKRIDAITIADLDRVGKKYFNNEGLNLAVIGNFDAETEKGKAARTKLAEMLSL